jgi:hypothetical protein
MECPAAIDPEAGREPQRDRFRISPVLLFQYPRRKSLHRIVVAHLDRALQDYRPVIELFIDYMNRAPGYLDAMLEGLALRVETRKGGQQ